MTFPSPRLRQAALRCLGILLGLSFPLLVLGAGQPTNVSEKTFTLIPIGHLERTNGVTRLVLEERFQPGLKGLEDFSHVWVIWWFDRNDTPQRRAILQVHPRGNPKHPLTGVFATRAPVRPNLIALSLCKIVRVEDNIVVVEGLDAFEDSPVLDLKPYAPGIDLPGVRVPDWARGGGPPMTQSGPHDSPPPATVEASMPHP